MSVDLVTWSASLLGSGPRFGPLSASITDVGPLPAGVIDHLELHVAATGSAQVTKNQDGSAASAHLGVAISDGITGLSLTCASPGGTGAGTGYPSGASTIATFGPTGVVSIPAGSIPATGPLVDGVATVQLSDIQALVFTVTATSSDTAADSGGADSDGNIKACSVALTSLFVRVVFVLEAAIYPPSGPTVGGEVVYVTGEGFDSSCTVTIGGLAATTTFVPAAPSGASLPGTCALGDIYVLTTTGQFYLCDEPNVWTPIAGTGAAALTCVTPPNVVGVYDVVITRVSDGAVVTLPLAFTYVPLALIGATPFQGSTRGGTVVTITGTGFGPGLTVTIGGLAAPVGTLTYGLTDSATCTIPAHAAGLVNLVAMNTDGTTSTLTGFAYVTLVTAPTITLKTPHVTLKGLRPAGVWTQLALTPGQNNGPLTYAWTALSGPNGPFTDDDPFPGTIDAPTALNTFIGFATAPPPGAYQLQCAITTAGITTYQALTITVPPTVPPVVSAGAL
jgi:IPT/TIG domain